MGDGKFLFDEHTICKQSLLVIFSNAQNLS